MFNNFQGLVAVVLLEATSLLVADVTVENGSLHVVFKLRNLLQFVVLLEQREATSDRVCT